ncbi:MAG: DnaJ domain-containing protein [Chloroflexia bacterium]
MSFDSGGSENYYEILGLGPGASEDEVEEAYADLSGMFAADRVPASRQDYARRQRRRLAAAYSVLADPERRAAYDGRLRLGMVPLPTAELEATSTLEPEPEMSPSPVTPEPEIWPVPEVPGPEAPPVPEMPGLEVPPAPMIPEPEVLPAPMIPEPEVWPAPAIPEMDEPLAVALGEAEILRYAQNDSVGETTVLAPIPEVGGYDEAEAEDEADEFDEDEDEDEADELDETEADEPGEDEAAPVDEEEWEGEDSNEYLPPPPAAAAPAGPTRLSPVRVEPAKAASARNPQPPLRNPQSAIRNPQGGVALPNLREATQIAARRAAAAPLAAAPAPARSRAGAGRVASTGVRSQRANAYDDEIVRPRTTRKAAPRKRSRRMKNALALQIMTLVIGLVLVLGTVGSFLSTTSPSSTGIVTPGLANQPGTASTGASQLVNTGNTQAALGQYTVAEAMYQGALQTDPNNLDAMLGLATSYMRQQPPDPGKAAVYATQLKQIAPNSPQAAQAQTVLNAVGPPGTALPIGTGAPASKGAPAAPSPPAVPATGTAKAPAVTGAPPVTGAPAKPSPPAAPVAGTPKK